MLFTPQTLLYAVIGGIVPALIWLYFLLREDSRCPEPRSLILIALGAGMLSVLAALPLEHLAIVSLPTSDPYPGTRVIVAWATIEEALKVLLAFTFVLWRREVNESVDFVMYMITVALGFAALENVLFLVAPLADGHVSAGIATQNLRFIGSTLVHVVSSSLVGFSLAVTYKSSGFLRALAVLGGLVLAIALHGVFNFLIILRDGQHTFGAFVIVWIATIVFLGLFEVLKYIRYRRLPKNTC